MLLMLDEQLKISNRTLKTWEENIRAMEALKRGGKTNEAAVLQAKANKLSVEANVLTLEKYLLSRIINLDFIVSWSKHQISTFPKSGGGNWSPEGAVVSELLCGALSGQTRLMCLRKRCGKETVRKHYIQLQWILLSW